MAVGKGMPRRGGLQRRRPARGGQGGRTAQIETDCERCPNKIKPGQQYIPRKDGWIHTGCASGADDE